MLLIRADANRYIASGHVMRCAAIARELIAKGQEILFLTADRESREFVESLNLPVIELGTKWDDLEYEIPQVRDLLAVYRPEWLIIDSYYVTSRYLQEIKKCTKIAYIDDIYAFAYPVDCLINYNIYSQRDMYEELYDKSSLKMPTMLLGADFAPLRTQFKDIEKRNVKERVENVLISTGGADPLHITLKFLQYIKKNSDYFEDYSFHVVIGTLNPDRELIKKEFGGEHSIVLHENVSDMKSLMMNADIAFSAAGSTLYELCACGLPTITYALADNQLRAMKKFADDNIMVSLGDIRQHNDVNACVCKAIVNLENAYGERKAMSQEMQRLVDGKGVERICNFLIQS